MAKFQNLQGAHSARQAADDILAAARAALDGMGTDTPSDAIHDFRLALKRWRALLRLLKALLEDEVVVLRSEARLLSREFSRSRDAQAALDALADIVAANEEAPPISKRTQATMTARLEAIRNTTELIALDAGAAHHRRDSLARAATSASLWPLERITFGDIAAGLTQSYRRVRRRLPHDWEMMTTEEAHDLRKALVTFRYQLELIEQLWPKVWRTFIAEVQRVRLQLGRSNDLVVLRELTQPKQPLAHWRSRLIPLIEDRRHFHLARARMLASRMFAESPRSFQKRIGAMWKAATAAAEPEQILEQTLADHQPE